MAPRDPGRLAWALLLAGAWSACSRGNDAEKTATQASASAPVSSAPAPCPEGSHRVGQACEADAPPPGGSASAPAASGSAEPAPPPGKCPDPSNAERIGVFDWEKGMQVDAAMASKLRGLSGAAAEVSAFGTEVDLELRNECARMATELGAKGPFTSTEAACQSALDALKTVRGKLGPTAKVRVFSHAPVCLMATDVAAECTKRCDSRQVEVACAPGAQGGKCTGTCDGDCEGRSAGKCAGTCEGSCDSGFSGTCQGICKGTCAGKDMKQGGECTGKCEGACEGVAKGECKGVCRGGCQMKAGTCDGQCVGKCSAPVKDALCQSGVKIPAADALCGPYCDTRSARKATCTPGQASVLISNAKDTAAAKQYERVVEVNLPVLLRIEQRLKGRLDGVNRARSAVTDGLKELTGSGSSSLAQLSPCLFAYDKAVVEGSNRLTAANRSVGQLTAAAQGR